MAKSKSNAVREQAMAMALVRRNRVHRMRPHVPEMLMRMYLHVIGEQEMTDEGYRETREWLMRFMACDRSHEYDIQANLPHLRLVVKNDHVQDAG